MSIGPTPKEDETFIQSSSEKAVTATKKIATAFFFDPVHYLFYTSLTGLIFGLFLNIRFTWQLYAIVAALGVVKAVKHFFFTNKQDILPE